MSPKLTKPILSLLLASALAAGLAAQSSTNAAGSTNCRMAQIAELPVRLIHNKLIVDGAINGRKIGIMLDTGATFTVILRPAAIRFELNRQKARDVRMVGIGGETDVETVLVDEFKIGPAAIKSRRMLVAGEHEIGDDIAVILGEDIFHAIDVEFDLAHNAVRLFQPRDCDGVALAYWATNGASVVEIEPVDVAKPRIVLTVQINGKPVRALLDSGAGTSVLDRPQAIRLGVPTETLGVATGRGVGLGQKAVDWRLAPLQSFAIGDETIKDTEITLLDLSGTTNYTATGSLVPRNVEGTTAMLLGADFLRAHRMLVSHSQRKIYFTYAGGPVFQRTEQPRPADDRGPADTK